ncbi:MAG: glycosyltransferase family 2 protein [Pirellulales bacterium]
MPETRSNSSPTHSLDDRPCLSLVIPVFNEAPTLRLLVERVRAALADFSYEVIIVDDGSTDGTTALVDELSDGRQVRRFIHPTNLGKGAALRTGFHEVHGRIVVIQDADLEYAPADIPRLVQPILDGRADVVYGSRFREEAPRSAHFWHRMANTMLTTLSNLFNDLHLTDMETGYKAFRAEVIQEIAVAENRFGVEPELTAKIARRGYHIVEIPISYSGRDYSHGKKIGFRDAFRAVWCLIRYNAAD